MNGCSVLVRKHYRMFTNSISGGSRISEKEGLLNNKDQRGRVWRGYPSRPARGSGAEPQPPTLFNYIMVKTLHKTACVQKWKLHENII